MNTEEQQKADAMRKLIQESIDQAQNAAESAVESKSASNPARIPEKAMAEFNYSPLYKNIITELLTFFQQYSTSIVGDKKGYFLPNKEYVLYRQTFLNLNNLRNSSSVETLSELNFNILSGLAEKLVEVIVSKHLELH